MVHHRPANVDGKCRAGASCLVEFVLLPREQVYFTPKISQISAQSCSFHPLAPPTPTILPLFFSNTQREFLSRYDQKASTLFLIFICIFSSLFLESFEATQQTFFVNQDVTNEERETNTDAERKDKRRALLPTVSAVVSRLVKCNVRAVISMLVPKKAFIVLTSRALWKCYRFQISFVVFFLLFHYIVNSKKKKPEREISFFTLKIKF